MSKTIGVGVFIAIALTVILPMVAVIIVMGSFGVAEYILPILIPSFLSMILIACFAGIAVFAGSRMVNRARYLTSDGTVTSPQGQIPDGLPEFSVPHQKRFFMIPVYCPHCGNALDLQRVGWSTSKTLTCPDCDHEIDVKMM